MNTQQASGSTDEGVELLKSGQTTNKSRSEKLIRRIVDGVCSWLTYKQCCDAYELYNEHYTYGPIHDIVKSLGLKISAQVPKKSTPSQSGAPSTTELVIYEQESRSMTGDRPFTVLEIKLVTGKNLSQQLENIAKDLDKLSEFDLDKIDLEIDLNPPYHLTKLFMVFGLRGDFEKLLETKPRETKRKNILELIRCGLADELKGGISYTRESQSAFEKNQHWVGLAFDQHTWTKDLLPYRDENILLHGNN